MVRRHASSAARSASSSPGLLRMARPWHCGCARQRNFTNANIYCSPTIRGKFPGLNQEDEPSDYRTLVGSLDINAEIEAPVKCAMAEVHGTGHERVSKLAQPDRLTGVYRRAGQGQLVSISSHRHQDSYRSWMTATRTHESPWYSRYLQVRWQAGKRCCAQAQKAATT